MKHPFVLCLLSQVTVDSRALGALVPTGITSEDESWFSFLWAQLALDDIHKALHSLNEISHTLRCCKSLLFLTELPPASAAPVLV